MRHSRGGRDGGVHGAAAIRHGTLEGRRLSVRRRRRSLAPMGIRGRRQHRRRRSRACRSRGRKRRRRWILRARRRRSGPRERRPERGAGGCCREGRRESRCEPTGVETNARGRKRQTGAASRSDDRSATSAERIFPAGQDHAAEDRTGRGSTGSGRRRRRNTTGVLPGGGCIERNLRTGSQHRSVTGFVERATRAAAIHTEREARGSVASPTKGVPEAPGQTHRHANRVLQPTRAMGKGAKRTLFTESRPFQDSETETIDVDQGFVIDEGCWWHPDPDGFFRRRQEHRMDQSPRSQHDAGTLVVARIRSIGIAHTPTRRPIGRSPNGSGIAKGRARRLERPTQETRRGAPGVPGSVRNGKEILERREQIRRNEAPPGTRIARGRCRGRPPEAATPDCGEPRSERKAPRRIEAAVVRDRCPETGINGNAKPDGVGHGPTPETERMRPEAGRGEPPAPIRCYPKTRPGTNPERDQIADETGNGRADPKSERIPIAHPRNRGPARRRSGFLEVGSRRTPAPDRTQFHANGERTSRCQHPVRRIGTETRQRSQGMAAPAGRKHDRGGDRRQYPHRGFQHSARNKREHHGDRSRQHEHGIVVAHPEGNGDGASGRQRRGRHHRPWCGQRWFFCRRLGKPPVRIYEHDRRSLGRIGGNGYRASRHIGRNQQCRRELGPHRKRRGSQHAGSLFSDFDRRLRRNKGASKRRRGIEDGRRSPQKRHRSNRTRRGGRNPETPRIAPNFPRPRGERECKRVRRYRRVRGSGRDPAPAEQSEEHDGRH
mmetsp:Transcript_21165/g.43518  ORF Transcript_21165/g.43518 Transcript_21165/m.43518 type:complete len:776 (-) Transcript_21165:1925-4252(-)